jgi:N utilization substance protein A
MEGIKTVKLSTENVRTITAFENITKVQPKDCIITENFVYFLVDSKKMGLAIGKNGSVIKEVKRVLGKPIKIFAHYDSVEEFLKKIIPNVRSIDINDNGIIVSAPQSEKLTIIGKNGENIKVIREILKRHFGVENFKLR